MTCLAGGAWRGCGPVLGTNVRQAVRARCPRTRSIPAKPAGNSGREPPPLSRRPMSATSPFGRTCPHPRRREPRATRGYPQLPWNQGDGWSCVTPRCAWSSIRTVVPAGNRSTLVRWRDSTPPAESSCACGVSRTFRLAGAAAGVARRDLESPLGGSHPRKLRSPRPPRPPLPRDVEVRRPPAASSLLCSS